MKPKQPPDDDPPPRFMPPEDWIDRLAGEYTLAMRRRLERYTARQILGINSAGYPVDDYVAEELVQDAMNDTMAGVVHWDPAVKPSLEQHLQDVLAVRTKRVRIRAKKYPRASIDGWSRSGAATTLEEVEEALQEQTPGAATKAYAAEVMAELREVAREDRFVLRLLNAFAQGAVTRGDVMHVTGFSGVEYHNAHRRLDRYVDELSNQSRPRNAAKEQHHASKRQ
jgi:hypothetical protein